MNKLVTFLVLVLVSFIFCSSRAEAKTAVTISVEAGPAFTEGNLTTVDFIVPPRPIEAFPLKVGDMVFFGTLEPLLEGEGTITAIYEINDTTVTPITGTTIKEAIIIDHVLHE